MFLSQLASEIHKRFPLQEYDIIAMMQIMKSNEATNAHRQLKSFIKLAMQFPSLVYKDEFDNLQDEALLNTQETESYDHTEIKAGMGRQSLGYFQN